jgi:hypothetical protein
MEGHRWPNIIAILERVLEELGRERPRHQP